MAYKNRTIELRFDGTSDLPDLGDDIVVTIRNPQLQSPAKLIPKDVALGADGSPLSQADAMGASYEVIAGLIVSWNVYDPDDDSDTPALLGEPTVDTVAKMPMAILTAISQEMDASAPN